MWVTFELGRPLGVPNDAMFQTRVLLAALKLLEAPSGPLIDDFPEDVPAAAEGISALACPLKLACEEAKPGDVEELREAFKREMNQLRSWYDLAVKKGGRTTVGVSGLHVDMIGRFISEFLDVTTPENPRKDLPLALTLRLAADDLKAYYYEAITARPGQVSPRSKHIDDWFWRDTIAAKVLRAIKQVCINSDDDKLRLVGTRFLVPMVQADG